MAVGIGAAGIIGVALEATPGTYLAPTKFVPVRSESLAWKQETVWRRAIMGTSDVIGPVPGNGSFDGDIEMEALHDCVPYFLNASRATITKTGPGPYTYDAKPNSLATPTKTMSITVVRNGVTFGYTNCIVTKQSWKIDNGLLIVTFSIMGSDEASQSTPTATFPTTVPFGAGQYAMEIPTATAVTDSDEWTFEVDDGGQQAYRLRTTGRGPAFAYFGDRSVSMSLNRDFQSRTEYDAFKNLTAKSVTFKAISGANEIDILMPISYYESYEVALGGTGELIRANAKFNATYDVTNTYKITVKTTENVT